MSRRATHREGALMAVRTLVQQTRVLRNKLKALHCFEDAADELTTAIRHLTIAVASLTTEEDR